MKALLERASLSAEEGSLNAAEMYAYSAGLELVDRELCRAEDLLSSDTGYGVYAALLALDGDKYGAERLRELTVKRASYKYALLTTEEFETELSLTGAEGISVSGNNIIIEGAEPSKLYELSVFLKGFSPLGRRVICDGGGMTFDLWDATGLCFSDYDRLGLTFDILDTLRSDTFEQY